MYSDVFCKVYNEFGWNYYPEIFGEQLLEWLERKNIHPKSAMDLACGTGILCGILAGAGIDASGMDFSSGMIAIARENTPHISYDVADMITYRPDKQFDLVTCTGDALNHILDMENVGKIFQNVSFYLEKGGWFVFDLLNEKEISTEEPFDLDFSDTVKAQFRMIREEGGVCLQTTVFENGVRTVREEIHERVHDVDRICALLERAGLQVVSVSHSLLRSAPREAATWFIKARKT